MGPKLARNPLQHGALPRKTTLSFLRRYHGTAALQLASCGREYILLMYGDDVRPYMASASLRHQSALWTSTAFCAGALLDSVAARSKCSAACLRSVDERGPTFQA
eukprot:scaffold102714_cov63-Phaeocystis_antarctica.AAC.6